MENKSLKNKNPNAETIEAMNEIKEYTNNPKLYKNYNNFSEIVDEFISDEN